LEEGEVAEGIESNKQTCREEGKLELDLPGDGGGVQHGDRAAREELLVKEKAEEEEPRHGEKEMDGDGGKDDDFIS
jgi:hypothetical protein